MSTQPSALAPGARVLIRTKRKRRLRRGASLRGRTTDLWASTRSRNCLPPLRRRIRSSEHTILV